MLCVGVARRRHRTLEKMRSHQCFNLALPMSLEYRKEVSEFLAEIIEDVAMEQAIAEGETSELVSRESIFQLLEPKV
ncbi:hypothetical protein [Nostoc sp. FACHB-888]|uniref:hypothetical protein n=1 Tax=Nostoc sp. FACHB-888 TaxID=2692842 RepID=UPI001684D499|nr:hypothetical protein [Nostoc sp. FACHB-888]